MVARQAWLRAVRIVATGSAMLLSALVGTLAAPAVAQADVPAGLTWSATIAGQSLDGVTSGNPLQLSGSENTRVQVSIDNRSSDDFAVRSVRFEGRVLGMTFFSYAVRLDAVVPAETSTVREFDLDLSDLVVQSTGLVVADVSLVAPDRSVIATRPVPVKIAGSPFSAYGVFGLAVTLVTFAVLATLLIAIWRRRLPENRWRRALFFLPAGIGLGLVLTFALSAGGLLLPSPSRWVTLVVVLGAAAFVMGYLLPVGHRAGSDSPHPDQPSRSYVAAGGGSS